MAEKKNTPQKQNQPAPVVPGQQKIRLVKDAYEQYKIGGRIGSEIHVRSEVAEKMIAAGVAEIVK